MAPRLELQSLLESITENVYYQPPAGSEMQYPCILYIREGSAAEHADNLMYRNTKRYQVTVIDRNPDTTIPDAVENIRLSRFDRFFVADNLNHFVFSLYF